MLQVLVVVSQKVLLQKRGMGYAKVIQKKEKKKNDEKKWTQKCLRYLKQWVLRCPPEKNKMNKIAPAL